MKRPLSPLSLDVPAGTEPEQPAPTRRAPPKPPRTAMTYRPTIEAHEQLREISYLTRRPMQDLIDEAVAAWLERQRPR